MANTYYLHGTTFMLLNEIVSFFVDLIGGERHKLKEVKSINMSSSALGKCTDALVGNNAHVSFRDSKRSHSFEGQIQ